MTKESKKYRIYDKATKQWFEIPEEKYREYDRWRTALRKRMQYHGECSCSRDKWWLCDGVCQDCEFHNHTTISLDEPLPDGNGTRGDYIQDDNPTPEELMADRDLLEYLIMRLRETDPDANRIIRLLQDGISARKIAEILGRKQRTFSKELKLPTGKTCTFPIVIHLSATSIIKPQTFVVHYAYIPVVC